MSILHLVKDYFVKKMKHNSYHAHHSEYVEEGKLEKEKIRHVYYEKTNVFNSETLKFQDIIDKNPGIKVAIDIGSGAGFVANKLSQNFATVYGIEPSDAAIHIAKTINPNNGVHYINAFGEDGLTQIMPKIHEPIFFLCSTVLSHLDDEVVAKICACLEKAPVGSVFAFAECFGKTVHKHLWYIRKEEWWQKHLSSRKIDFFGPKIKYSMFGASCNKGFRGKKVA